MPDLSVIIITKNEADNIRGALESIQWANDIIVVDSGSTDDTLQIARQFTDRVISHDWEGFGAQKNYANSLAVHDWVLSIDADERLSTALTEEIRSLLEHEPASRGYRIPRVTWHLGRWVRTTDWYPDYQLRLFDRRVSRWSNRLVHESVVVEGPVSRLQNELEHRAYRNISHHLETIDKYTTLAATEMQQAGRRISGFDLVLHPPLAFLRNYFARGGIRDGSVGFIVSILNAYYVFLKFTKLWETKSTQRDD